MAPADGRRLQKKYKKIAKLGTIIRMGDVWEIWTALWGCCTVWLDRDSGHAISQRLAGEAPLGRLPNWREVFGP